MVPNRQRILMSFCIRSWVRLNTTTEPVRETCPYRQLMLCTTGSAMAHRQQVVSLHRSRACSCSWAAHVDTETTANTRTIHPYCERLTSPSSLGWRKVRTKLTLLLQERYRYYRQIRSNVRFHQDWPSALPCHTFMWLERDRLFASRWRHIQRLWHVMM